MIKIQCISLAILLLASCQEKPKEYTLAVGTYTKKEGHVDGKAQGIYIVNQNTETGQLTMKDTIMGVINPSYLMTHPTHQTIYAVNEVADNTAEDIGTISSFKPNESNGAYQMINKVSSKGDAPCHVALDQTGEYVIVTNYMGTISTMKINSDFSLSEAIDVKVHEGGDTLSIRQTSPHPHMSHLAPDGKTVLVADLGANSILHYQISDSGMLNLIATSLSTPKSGPRHMAVHNAMSKIYVLNELNNTVEVFNWENRDTPMTSQQMISTIREEDNALNLNSAAIRLHPNGNFLYVSNRNAVEKFQNSITVYSIDQSSGELSLVEIKASGGDSPRDFIIDPQGKFLLVAHQNSDDIKTYSISQDGSIEYTNQSFTISTPVCLSYFNK